MIGRPTWLQQPQLRIRMDLNRLVEHQKIRRIHTNHDWWWIGLEITHPCVKPHLGLPRDAVMNFRTLLELSSRCALVLRTSQLDVKASPHATFHWFQLLNDSLSFHNLEEPTNHNISHLGLNLSSCAFGKSLFRSLSTFTSCVNMNMRFRFILEREHFKNSSSGTNSFIRNTT